MLLRRLKFTLAAGFTVLLTLPLMAADLVMIEQPGCVYCERWNADLSAIYPKTPEGKFAPLRRIQMSETTQSGITFERAVNFTPTFVLIENNVELGRVEGYPGEDLFWGMLEMLLVAKTDFTAAGS